MQSRRALRLLLALLPALTLGPTRLAAADYLTGPAAGDPLDITLAYLEANAAALGFSATDLAEWTLSDRTTDAFNGLTHLYLRQRHAGIPVYHGILNASVDAQGRIVHLAHRWVGDLAPAVNATAPSLSAEEAVRRAAEQLGLDAAAALLEVGGAGGAIAEVIFDGAALSRDPIPVSLALLPVGAGEVRLVWDPRLRPEGEHAWQMQVDAATGEVLRQTDLVQRDSYLVYEWPAESPNHLAAGPPLPPQDGRTVAENPANLVASPRGWHDLDGLPGPDTVDTTGNNVFAQTDVDDNDVFLPGSEDVRPVSPTRDFAPPLDLTLEPETYREAAVANLFYWNNVIHDLHYLYGFDEASGNFQFNNYGRGGVGFDPVRADAQDGSGTNNANMLTLPEGTPPRMQMFVWTAPSVVRVHTPASIAGDLPAAPAAFGAELDAVGLSGDVELVSDGSANPSQGCNALQGFTPGHIALIDRGTCEFGQKMLNAEQAGAIAGIVANNQGDDLVLMGPGNFGALVTIPSVFVGQSNGQRLKDGLATDTVNVTLRRTSVNRDSDFDNGVIAHEYGHGVSIRLTGGPAVVVCLENDQQGGEGWSDWHALALTQRAGADGTEPRGIGTYLLFEDDPATRRGIRPFPYSTDPSVNPQTYGDLAEGNLSVPHGVGSVWATTLWEMYWALVNGVPELGLPGRGFRDNLENLQAPLAGNQVALRQVMDGLKMQRCLPSFLDARDAILAADLASFGGAHQCHIWWAFAKRGMGIHAEDGLEGLDLDVTEDFTLPAECEALRLTCSELDDADPAVEYRSGWHRVSDPNASSGGYHRRAGRKNGGSPPTMRLVFDGQGVTYRFVKTAAGGAADVFLDGELVETISFATTSGEASPSYGHQRTYAGLAGGTHELRIEHREGVVTVDGFEVCGAGADASAVAFRSHTETSQGSAGEGPILERPVAVGADDEEVSVVVEGGLVPLTVQLLDPVGLLVAAGDALIDGLTLSGLDAATTTPGTYRVQVLNIPGAFETVTISVARTERVTP